MERTTKEIMDYLLLKNNNEMETDFYWITSNKDKILIRIYNQITNEIPLLKLEQICQESRKNM